MYKKESKEGELTMGFTTSAFIRKNTLDLRKKLEELGYKCSSLRCDRPCLYTAAYLNVYHSIHPEWLDNEDIRKPYDVDCGTNEDLFLAIAALRDDTDKNQWFTDGEKWILCPKIKFSTYWVCNDIGVNLDTIHKATVEELIEHFKEKEE